MTRALLRIAVLVGLVVCGWLLGTATGLAQEAGNDTAGVSPDWVHVAPAHHHHSSDPAVPAHSPAPEERTGGLLTPLAGSGVDAVVPVGQVLRLPARLPVTGVVVQAVEPLADPLIESADPLIESTVQPMAAQVLGSTAPQPSDRPAASPAVGTEDQQAPSQAAPVASQAGALAGPAVPLPRSTATRAPDPLAGTADLAADRLAGPSATDEHPGSPAPASPFGATGSSCPPGSTGANTVAQAAHAAVLGDAATTADPALVQRRMRTGAGGLPWCLGQRPSASPD